LHSAPKISELGDLPIKSVGGAMVYMHDVAHVHNGNQVQTNIVHVDGSRSVLLSVFKNGSTSTLDIVSGIKKMLLLIKPSLPDELEVKSDVRPVGLRARLDPGVGDCINLGGEQGVTVTVETVCCKRAAISRESGFVRACYVKGAPRFVPGPCPILQPLMSNFPCAVRFTLFPVASGYGEVRAGELRFALVKKAAYRASN
jgi:hypothetical protein